MTQATSEPSTHRHDPAAAATAGQEPEAATTSGRYVVTLDVFSGPFDLLLQLISERRLDVSEVDLAEITADFLAHLRIDDPTDPAGLAGLDLETATHFLVVAATLVELKAVRLLPKEERDELEDLLAEARDVLYARLLEYRAFRDAAEQIGELLDRGGRSHGRAAPLEARFRDLVPEVEIPLDAAGLAALAARALAPRPEPKVATEHIHRALVTVRDAARQMLDRLRLPGEAAAFRTLVGEGTRAERVVYFLAVLELYKVGWVDLEQEAPFADLFVARRDARSGAELDERIGEDLPDAEVSA
jgi:segregation and condensation protein A